AEDRTHGLVALKVDAANLASAVVEVEIGRELFVSGFERERAWRSPRRAPLRPWGWARGVMFFNVSARADQSLLFAAPESDPDCAGRLDAERLNDPHDLHRDSRSRAVVRGAGSRMPRIEMAADHHDLVLQIGAGDFSDHVVAHQILILELRGDLHFEF